jgi:predicted methyltransferase
MVRRTLLSSLLVAGLAACTSAPTQPDEQPVEAQTEQTETTDEAVAEEPSIEELLRAYADGEHRTEGNAARNPYRNPVETLSFFGLEPGMTVIELNPGRGWYTEILAPVLAAQGQLVLAYGDPEQMQGYVVEMIQGFEARLASEPDMYGKTRRAYLHPGHRIELGEPDSADLVLTFRNIHGWHNRGQLAEILGAVHTVLKPGGILGVVQHRAADGSSVEEVSKTGYMPETFVIETIEALGFELVAKSDINANPNDTKDYPEGVWTLPPTLRLGDQDRERYEAIGESDRMTLKFRKVAKAGEVASAGEEE